MPNKQMTWKRLACERLAIPTHANDSHVLDELIRAEIQGGNRLLLIRDHLAKLLKYMKSQGNVSEADGGAAMYGLQRVIQPLRTKVANQYRDEAQGNTGVVREDFQPPADYEG